MDTFRGSGDIDTTVYQFCQAVWEKKEFEFAQQILKITIINLKKIIFSSQIPIKYLVDFLNIDHLDKSLIYCAIIPFAKKCLQWVRIPQIWQQLEIILRDIQQNFQQILIYLGSF